MPAGQSALRRSQELEGDAETLFELRELKLKQARDFAIACVSERELAGILRPLAQHGWVVLEDRLWPGSKHANVDFVLIGPGGVVVLDAKSWAEVEIRDGSIFRGDSDEREEVEKLISLTDRISEGVTATGLTPSAVTAAMVFTGRSVRTQLGPLAVLGDRDVVAWIARLRHRLDPEQVATVAAAVEQCCGEIPEQSSRRLIRRSTERPKPRPAPVLESLIDADELAQAMIDSATAGPIEDWMTFLHPEQNKLVRTHWNGPARVRGPAGTGKTVVGLHRAVHLAQRASEPVVFVSFVKTLPIVLAALAKRISETASENIEFVGVHKLAHQCLDRVGETIVLDPRRVGHAFDRAWRQSGAAETLSRLDERRAYWQEEVDYVIKGRGLTDFEAYRDLVRIGRKTPMRAPEREAMWDLYVIYEAELASSGVADFNDLLIRAERAVATYPDLFRYSTVIIDEVQDLNLAAVQFLRTLAGDGPNALLIIGDGQQSVYPGGFTLTEAGISVTGRAAVLRHNYRNTIEILAEAGRIIANDTFEDLDGLPISADDAGTASRHGHLAQKTYAESAADLDIALVSMLERSFASGINWGDLAVLVERRKDLKHYRRVLEDHDVPAFELTEYDGVTTDHVKIGTIKRAKGLEFKYVLLPGLSEQPPAPLPGETHDSYIERCARWRRELYVAMTRARDGLWLGYLRDK